MGITHFIENHLIKIHKVDKKVVDHFVETTYGVKNPKPCRGAKVLGDERID